ncbi:MAG: type II secretion system protein [Planctomycetota bacterium]
MNNIQPEKRCKNRRGVTLIELTVSMGLVSMIAVMASSLVLTSNRFVTVNYKKFKSVGELYDITALLSRNMSVGRVPVIEGTTDSSLFLKPYKMIFQIPVNNKDRALLTIDPAELPRTTNTDRILVTTGADGVVDWMQPDSNTNGVPDWREFIDTNSDGIIDPPVNWGIPTGDYFQQTNHFLEWGRCGDIALRGGLNDLNVGSNGYIVITFIPSGEILDENRVRGQQQEDLTGINTAIEQFRIIGTDYRNINERLESVVQYSNSDQFALGCILVELWDVSGTVWTYVAHRTLGGVISDATYSAYNGGDPTNDIVRRHMRADIQELGRNAIAVPLSLVYDIYDKRGVMPTGTTTSLDGIPGEDPLFRIASLNKRNELPLAVEFKFAYVKYIPGLDDWVFEPQSALVQLRNPPKRW